MVGAMKEEDEVTEIYFGNDRYLLRNNYYAKDAEWDVEAQQRGWSVKLYDAKDIHARPIITFFSWWYYDNQHGLTEQGENEDFTIGNPHSDAVKELLKILEVGFYGKDDNPLYTLYRQIYESSGKATNIVDQLKKAIESAQKNSAYRAINNRWVP
jgi:hypothetical protein